MDAQTGAASIRAMKASDPATRAKEMQMERERKIQEKLEEKEKKAAVIAESEKKKKAEKAAAMSDTKEQERRAAEQLHAKRVQADSAQKEKQEAAEKLRQQQEAERLSKLEDGGVLAKVEKTKAKADDLDQARRSSIVAKNDGKHERAAENKQAHLDQVKKTAAGVRE
uniref:Uncharacterized protein n=1 Tax=Chromera velia CCMP2878 TaxID=1169474 RepID=A0A0G4HET0_9ALVE|eukprot:Cvel_26864.t1-p1 / transcript=Cvel_26864.t1 / gene=Cvel_26864 / organism=Chromera_velia_CCMP2878 / gene_product=hypothetical protein / transcript_product=hypothetical protein / location=Cvel_scaffold3260:4359-6932(-) / protein_length=167 / sequence_SO=supercontig / SO=protein_coding / is_pseudo=false